MAIANANNLIAPLLAFDLDPFDPIVYLLFHEVAKFFAPGFEKALSDAAICTWWLMQRRGIQEKDWESFVNADHKFDFRYIGSVCVKFVKFVASECSAYGKRNKEIAARQKALADTVVVKKVAKTEFLTARVYELQNYDKIRYFRISFEILKI
jgi:hypothetical protein